MRFNPSMINDYQRPVTLSYYYYIISYLGHCLPSGVAGVLAVSHGVNVRMGRRLRSNTSSTLVFRVRSLAISDLRYTIRERATSDDFNDTFKPCLIVIVPLDRL